MRTRIRERIRTALPALVLVLGAVLWGAPRAGAATVASVTDFYTQLITWTTGDLSLTDLPAGTYDITTSNLAAAAWVTTGLPGNLSISGAATTLQSEVIVNLGIPLKPTLVGTVNPVPTGITADHVQLSFAGGGRVDDTLNTTTTPIAVSLNRVWLPAGTLPITKKMSLTMTSCLVTGASIAVQGEANISRCTFLQGSGLTFGTSAIGSVNANLFIQAPIISGQTVTGAINYVGGSSGTTLPAGFSVPTIPSAPLFDTAGWWPGKLLYSLFPRDAAAATPSSGATATNDFEGDPIDNTGRPQIGADQVDRVFPRPAWRSCTITGPAGACIKDSFGSPIVRGGVPVQVVIDTLGLVTPATLAGVGTATMVTKLVVVPEGETYDPKNPASAPDAIIYTLAQSDFKATGLANDYTFAVSVTAPTNSALDGYATVVLDIDGSLLDHVGSATGPSPAQKFLVDNIPPAVPTSFAVTMGGGLPQICPTADATQYITNAGDPLNVVLTVPLIDQPNAAGHTTSNFSSSLISITDAQVSATSVDQFDNSHSTWGAASWLSFSPGDFGTQTTMSRTATSNGTATTFTISGIRQPAIPTVFKWEANLQITDCAGNSTKVPIVQRFWWMPAGSTWARVVGDNGDPNAPSFGWELESNSISGNPTQITSYFAGCTQAPTARFLLMHGSDADGWTDVNGLDWTDPTTEPTVGPSSLMGKAPTTVVFGDALKNMLGDTVTVIAALSNNPAGLVPIPTWTSYAGTLADLETQHIFHAGPYVLPSHPPEGSLDTSVSVKYFLNRTDHADITSLWNIDSDETTYGSGPNVPLTPLDACNQRLEAEFTIDVGVPDILGVPKREVAVEFWLYKDGALMARGNLQHFSSADPNNPGPMRLYIPTDLIDLANGGHRNPTCNIFVPLGNRDPIGDPTAFAADACNAILGPDASHVNVYLAHEPQICQAVNGDVKDRLGDDGPIFKPGDTDQFGKLQSSARTRAIQYTLVVAATTNQFSANSCPQDQDTTFLYDPTPATIRFIVQPDQSPDSDNPRVKVNGAPIPSN